MSDTDDLWTAPEASLSEGKSRHRGLLTRFVAWVFLNPKDPVTLFRVFLWWEARRVPFNLIVGTYGILCLVIFFAAITTSGHLEPGEDAVEPFVLIAAPFVVNALYTLGWIVELNCRSHEPGLSPRFGPRLLKLGLGLGLFLSTVPVALWSGYRLLQWAGVAS